MTRDLIYAFDKKTFIGKSIGEIQRDFNMSFVIDGTKDSAKVDVWSFSNVEIEPYTIIYHPKTETWWIVDSDKVERYMNDNGFYYQHSLELIGAIELLNARDLTDCGFNDNTYTISQFILRLFSLSNFEYNYNAEHFFQANDNFLNKNVDFIKTFENYTLLSALREFLDAYNMSAKLSFSSTYNATNDTYLIDYPLFYIIPKTGDYSLTQHDIDDFEQVRETRTMNKDNFGATVVSNAENVISTHQKTYPAVGSIRVSGKEYQIEPESAVIRLPSNVFKGNWIKLHGHSGHFKLSGYIGNFSLQDMFATPSLGIDDIDIAYAGLIDMVRNADTQQYGDGRFFTPFYNALKSSLTLIADTNNASTITLYNGNDIVPDYDNGTVKIEKGANVPYLAKLRTTAHISAGSQPCVFVDKDTKNLLPRTWQGIAWERGKNEITGFDIFVDRNDAISVEDYMFTDLQQQNNYVIFAFSNNYGQLNITLDDSLVITFKDLLLSINYIPMTDLKIKVDNTIEKLDIQLYNQNGRITDNVALSKLLNSYSKEISSDTITKTMIYRRFKDVPKVGSIVFNGRIPYVINNISLDFSQNENAELGTFAYFIDTQITMSKYFAIKSLMVNPNSNIRDYGIPQNFNVKRKQLYRDYYEFGYDYYDSANEQTPYLPTTNIIVFGHRPNNLDSFVGVFKVNYLEPIGGDAAQGIDPSDTWYYQLETTNYYLNKMFYSVLDFKDNNIIGYGSQNVFSGFDITRIFSGNGLTDILNTPITYTDDNGELEGVDIYLLTNDKIREIYDDYKTSQGGGSWDGSIYNYSCFIPSDIYDMAALNYSIHIEESSYYKDALEIPVFEYVCQLADSDEVLIGDNVLTQYDSDYIYFYTYVVGDNLTQDNALDDQSVIGITRPLGFRVNNGTNIEYDNVYKVLRITFYRYQRFVANDGSFTNVQQQPIELNKDYAVFRHAYNLRTQEDKIELMFIAKSVPNTNVSSNNILTLFINHYKLK